MTTPGQPGWYDDPQDPNAQRYWDGQGWTPHSQQKPGPQTYLRPAAPMAAQPPLPTEPYAQGPYPVFPPASDPYGQWAPAGQPPVARRSYLPAILIVAIVGVVTLVIAGVLVYKFALSDHPVSDQDQIKALVATFTDDFNKSDGQGLTTLVCKTSPAIKPNEMRHRRSESGPLSTSVTDVTVTGESATAQVNMTVGAKSTPTTWQFSKENGAWKVCKVSKQGHRMDF